MIGMEKTYTILLKKDDYVVISNLHRIQQITFIIVENK